MRNLVAGRPKRADDTPYHYVRTEQGRLFVKSIPAKFVAFGSKRLFELVRSAKKVVCRYASSCIMGNCQRVADVTWTQLPIDVVEPALITRHGAVVSKIIEIPNRLIPCRDAD